MEPQQDYPLRAEAPQNIKNPLAVMQPGERVVCEIRRHPFGLLSIYAMALVVIAASLATAILVPYYVTSLTNDQKVAVVLSCGLVVLVTLLIAYIGVYIYNANRWIVTTDSITQISQIGLFNTRSSQLSLANLEDVSAHQDGLIAQLVGFGNLTVETAGERSKFVFAFCPNPNECARKIIAAHEEYIASRPNEMVATSRPLATSQGFNQPMGPVQPAA